MAGVDFFFCGLPGRGLVNNNQAPGVSELHFGRLYRVNAQMSFFNAPVSFVYGLIKKGVGVWSSDSATFIGLRRGSLVLRR